MTSDPDLTAFLSGKRIVPDVSVLLTGLLVPGSDSADLLAIAEESVLVLPADIEEKALNVLRFGAPQLLGAYGDAVLRLSQSMQIERHAGSDATPRLPDWTAELDGEDLDVLRSAVSANADILFTQDSDFFGGRVDGLEIRVPSSLLWTLRSRTGKNFSIEPEAWTFVGWFIPQWGSDWLRDDPHTFYIFDLQDHIWCYYETADERYRLRWRTSSSSGTLTIPLPVKSAYPHFVAVAVSPSRVFFFCDGETRGKDTRLGPHPGTRFYNFSSSSGEHQISGSVQFALHAGAMSESLIRKHWKANSVALLDREVELHEMIGPLLES